jgi:hypothetical protein
VRRADGQLEQLPRGAFDYFELPRPLDLTPPERDEDPVPGPGPDHRARVSSFRLDGALGRRWSARCTCGWIATTGSHPEACEEFARHYRESREPLAWRADTQADRAAA